MEEMTLEAARDAAADRMDALHRNGNGAAPLEVSDAATPANPTRQDLTPSQRVSIGRDLVNDILRTYRLRIGPIIASVEAVGQYGRTIQVSAGYRIDPLED